MTPTPEAVEAAAIAISAYYGRPYPDPLFTGRNERIEALAHTALTAALPLLLDQLIAEAETPKVLTRDMISRDQAWREFVAWLRSQKGTTNDQ